MYTTEFVSPQHCTGKEPYLHKTLPSESFLLVVNSTGPFIRQIFFTIRQTGNLALPTIKIITQIASVIIVPKPALFLLGFLLKTWKAGS